MVTLIQNYLELYLKHCIFLSREQPAFYASVILAFQAVRNDRNSLSKKLTESQDETGDLKSKLKMLNHQFDQLKEEIEIKEGLLVKEGQEQTKLQKEKEDLSEEVDR